VHFTDPAPRNHLLLEVRAISFRGKTCHLRCAGTKVRVAGMPGP
jgi:hypothetical protein